MRRRCGFRALAVVYVVVGFLLLPFTLFFGLLLAPLLAGGSLWLMVVGYRLWCGADEVGAMLR